MRGRNIYTSAAILLCMVTFQACGSGAATTSEISRHKLYKSLSGMTQDSSFVVVGKVSKQDVVADIPGDDLKFTLSSLIVERVVKGEKSSQSAGVVVVRQVGSDDQAAPVPLLQVGGTYLLFLTPSGLDGSRAAQFYVTGANAGIYRLNGDGAPRGSAQWDALSFSRQNHQQGDELPELLTPASVAKTP